MKRTIARYRPNLPALAALTPPAVVLAYAPAWADADGRGYGPGMMWDGWGWGHFIFGPLMMIAFIAVVVVVVVLIVRWLTGTSTAGAPPSAESGKDSLDILKERYARGEIDRQEYQQKKKDLS